MNVGASYNFASGHFIFETGFHIPQLASNSICSQGQPWSLVRLPPHLECWDYQCTLWCLQSISFEWQKTQMNRALKVKFGWRSKRHVIADRATGHNGRTFSWPLCNLTPPRPEAIRIAQVQLIYVGFSIDCDFQLDFITWFHSHTPHTYSWSQRFGEETSALQAFFTTEASA